MFNQLAIPGYLHVDTYPKVINCLYTDTLFYLTTFNFSLRPLRVTAGKAVLVLFRFAMSRGLGVLLPRTAVKIWFLLTLDAENVFLRLADTCHI
jgi:hypothetical protein